MYVLCRSICRETVDNIIFTFQMLFDVHKFVMLAVFFFFFTNVGGEKIGNAGKVNQIVEYPSRVSSEKLFVTSGFLNSDNLVCKAHLTIWTP